MRCPYSEAVLYTSCVAGTADAVLIRGSTSECSYIVKADRFEQKWQWLTRRSAMSNASPADLPESDPRTPKSEQ